MEIGRPSVENVTLGLRLVWHFQPRVRHISMSPLTTTVCHLLNVGPTKDNNTTGLYKRLVEFCNCRITAEFIIELADTRGICHPSQKMFKRLLTTWRSYHCHRLLWHYFTLCILDNLCLPALPVKNQRILVELSFTVHMPFLTATSAFRLARTH